MKVMPNPLYQNQHGTPEGAILSSVNYHRKILHRSGSERLKFELRRFESVLC